MRYYGLVDEIRHESGIYGRKELSEQDLNNIKKSLNNNQTQTPSLLDSMLGNDILKVVLPIVNPYVGAGYIAFNLFKNYLNPNSSSDIKLLAPNPNSKIKSIIMTNDSLDNNYNIENNLELFYGLFDNFPNKNSSKLFDYQSYYQSLISNPQSFYLPDKNKVFETIMKSKGGSEFIILEKEDVPTERHYGGIYGKFSTGIYFEHPKNNNILLPLENSTNLIRDIILEETLRAFEALGAKQIIIEDHTEVGVQVGVGATVKGIGVNAGTNSNTQVTILKRKEFGKGVFDPQRCMNNLLFVPDFPNIMTVINSRIYGNQIKEEFTETINLSAGLDIGVINLFQANFGINTTRRWHFSVEFYDKNEMKIY